MGESRSIDDLFFQLIGHLTITWGNVEGMLLALIRVIRMTNPDFEPEPQKGLERKLEFLKKAGKKIPYLSPYRNRIIDITSSVRIHSKLRNHIIHSYIESRPTKEVTAVNLRSFHYKHGKMVSQKHSYTMDEIIAEIMEVQKVIDTGYALFNEIMDVVEALPKQKRQSVFQQILNRVRRYPPILKAS